MSSRTIEVKLTSGRSVLRNCNDIVPCSTNKNSEICLDILDLPLWPRDQEELHPNQSEFDIFLPEIDVNIPAVPETN